MVVSYTEFTGQFFDGQSARHHDVSGRFDDTGLSITGDSLSERVFWAYDDLREVQDQAGGEGITLRAVDHLGRLKIADGHSASVVRGRADKLTSKDVTRREVSRIVKWGAGAVVSVLLILFVIIPALANQLATLIPIDREVALGKTTLRQIERFLGADEADGLVCDNPAGVAALEKMTARLTENLDSPYAFDIKVFDHEMINAFAVPGGHIVLFQGLIDSSETPEEVAGVLGHEMGHVINRDPTRLTLRSAGSAGILGMLFGDFAGGAVALIIAERLIAADYAQEAETNADKFAHELLAGAGLPSSPFAGFFDKLIEEYGESEGFFTHIASHPALGERADAARAADTVKKTEYTPVLSDAEWADLQKICAAE